MGIEIANCSIEILARSDTMVKQTGGTTPCPAIKILKSLSQPALDLKTAILICRHRATSTQSVRYANPRTLTAAKNAALPAFPLFFAYIVAVGSFIISI